MLSIIWVFDSPANTISVRLNVRGRMDRAAAGLKQSGTRTLGLQNSVELNGFIHDRSTIQTKPFFPSMAVSYPRHPRTRIFASLDIAAGAALRAKAISALRSGIRYCSIEAMLGYAVERFSFRLRSVRVNFSPTATQTIANAPAQTQRLVVTLFFNLGALTFAASRFWRRSPSVALISEGMPASGDSTSQAISACETSRKSAARAWHSVHSSRCDKASVAWSAGSSPSR